MRFKTSLRAGQILTNNELMKEFSVANSGGMRKSNKNNVLVIISDHTKGLYDDKYYGGNNLIAPVASSAIQNFYGDRGDEAADQPEDSEKTENTESVADEKPAQEPAELSDDEFYVSVYIPDIKVMRAYKILLGECTTARELAVVVGKMLADENCRNVDKHTVVKAAFIKSLLPFAKRLVSGGTIANIRAQINNMLASK